jgi:hypothetical protein
MPRLVADQPTISEASSLQFLLPALVGHAGPAMAALWQAPSGADLFSRSPNGTAIPLRVVHRFQGLSGGLILGDLRPRSWAFEALIGPQRGKAGSLNQNSTRDD